MAAPVRLEIAALNTPPVDNLGPMTGTRVTNNALGAMLPGDVACEKSQEELNGLVFYQVC